MTHTDVIEIETTGFCDIQNITEELYRIVAASGVGNGIACVANPGSTAGITTVEFEPGAVSDLREALERIAPMEADYRHDAKWGDGNGFAHLRSALIGTAFTLPVIEGKPALGVWQQVVFMDFDNRRRNRTLQVVVTGD